MGGQEVLQNRPPVPFCSILELGFARIRFFKGFVGTSQGTKPSARFF